MLDFKLIKETAEKNKEDLFKFLRDIVRIPSFDGFEGDCMKRIAEEMEKIGYDKIEYDPLGNLIGTIGHGSHLIAMDGHADVVGLGNPDDWSFDPLEGFEDDKYIGGRGSSDMKGGLASMVYAGKIIKDLGLEGDYTLMVVASVQEEDCEGRNWQYIINEDKIIPECVIFGEPSNDRIFNAQKGRMEISIHTKGKSSHGSMPHLGVNAIYKMAPIISDIEKLNDELKDDGYMGKGTITVTGVTTHSPSTCAVCDDCTISVDRRLNSLESTDYALEQLRSLQSVKDANADVTLFEFKGPSYTGKRYDVESLFPSWRLDESHKMCQALKSCFEGIYEREPEFAVISGSTNGIATMGMHQIPSLIYGPGMLEKAHMSDEYTCKDMLVNACAVFAAFPLMYVE